MDESEKYRSLIEDPDKLQEINWKSSKEDQWALLEEKLGSREEAPKGKQIFFSPSLLRMGMAAAVALLVAFSFMRFYSISHSTPFGQQMTVALPDGTSVQLNAGSEISYHPYYWRFKRDVTLQGEAYFEVEKGSAFTVSSDLGTTTVLGTKFNVFARGITYRVACYEGSVQVSNNAGNKAILKPSEKAIIENNAVSKSALSTTETTSSWRTNYFIFTDSDIREVLMEMERHYNKSIQYLGGPLPYTGDFPRTFTLEKTLSIVALSLNLEVVKNNDGTFELK